MKRADGWVGQARLLIHFFAARKILREAEAATATVSRRRALARRGRRPREQVSVLLGFLFPLNLHPPLEGLFLAAAADADNCKFSF